MNKGWSSVTISALVFLLYFCPGPSLGQLTQQSALGQICTRGDGLPGRCTELSRCLGAGGTFENVGRIKLCTFSTNVNLVVCCRPYYRKIAEDKCREWSAGGSTGISATEFTQPHIAGGEKARVGEFPHMVSLMIKPNEHFCGGILVSPQYVLTAAHCIVMPVQDIEARMGAHDISNPNERGSVKVDVLDVLFPEGYRPPARYHDIALLRLSRDVTITRRIRPICLPYEPKLYLDTLIVSGWGYKPGVGALISDKLQKVDLNYDNQVKCNLVYGDPNVRQLFQTVYPTGITNTIICASKEGKDACKGDSGGPLIRHQPGTTGILVGIVSQGNGCPSNIPGTYTRVESYLDWIVHTIWPNELA